jgi:membrane protease YdiL (CAAX protease family)
MAGVALFVLLTFGLSWTLVPLVGRAWFIGASVPAGLLSAVLPYALVMGWQPLVAVLIVRTWVEPQAALDAGLRRGLRRLVTVAALGSLGILGAASFVKWSASSGPMLWSTSLASTAPSSNSALEVMAGGALVAATLLLIGGQALAEEIGFRGYLLPRAIQLFGTWPGLLLHAAVWGIWYAPLLLLATGNFSLGLIAGGGFAITCVLLGALLGCLRLSAASIVPSCTANSILTLAAGLPLLLQGSEAGLRAAIYEPFGWLPMLLLLLALRVAGLPHRAAERPARAHGLAQRE